MTKIDRQEQSASLKTLSTDELNQVAGGRIRPFPLSPPSWQIKAGKKIAKKVKKLLKRR